MVHIIIWFILIFIYVANATFIHFFTQLRKYFTLIYFSILLFNFYLENLFWNFLKLFSQNEFSPNTFNTHQLDFHATCAEEQVNRALWWLDKILFSDLYKTSQWIWFLIPKYSGRKLSRNHKNSQTISFILFCYNILNIIIYLH